MAERTRDNPYQTFFLILGVVFLVLAIWVGFAETAPRALGLMGSLEGRKALLCFTGGGAGFLFLLATLIHLKH